MGSYDEFPLGTRLFLKAYRWRRIDPTPWSRPAKKISDARVALVSSAGFVLRDQQPFDGGIRGGDWSFRTIPSDSAIADLVNAHRSEAFDPRGIAADANVAIPLDRMRELEQEKFIGDFSPCVISFMGSITAPARLLKESAPAIAKILQEDKVDAALLVPL